MVAANPATLQPAGFTLGSSDTFTQVYVVKTQLTVGKKLKAEQVMITHTSAPFLECVVIASLSSMHGLTNAPHVPHFKYICMLLINFYTSFESISAGQWLK